MSLGIIYQHILHVFVFMSIVKPRFCLRVTLETRSLSACRWGWWSVSANNSPIDRKSIGSSDVLRFFRYHSRITIASVQLTEVCAVRLVHVSVDASVEGKAGQIVLLVLTLTTTWCEKLFPTSCQLEFSETRGVPISEATCRGVDDCGSIKPA